MGKEYNTVAFTRGNVEAGLHRDLIEYLVNYFSNSDDRFNDIHITSDGECLIVEWVLVPFDRSYGGGFEYCGEDCYVMREITLPDDSTIIVFEFEDPHDVIEEWVKEHPGWKQHCISGRWVYSDDPEDLNIKDEEEN